MPPNPSPGVPFACGKVVVVEQILYYPNPLVSESCASIHQSHAQAVVDMGLGRGGQGMGIIGNASEVLEHGRPYPTSVLRGQAGWDDPGLRRALTRRPIAKPMRHPWTEYPCRPCRLARDST